jgi:hypothetical protein
MKALGRFKKDAFRLDARSGKHQRDQQQEKRQSVEEAFRVRMGKRRIDVPQDKTDRGEDNYE